MRTNRGLGSAGLLVVLALATRALGAQPEIVEPYPVPAELQGVDLSQQTAEEALGKSIGCMQCHQGVGDPHGKTTVRLGCCDCHGGNPAAASKEAAHIFPRFPDAWPSSANPVRTYTLLNHES